MNQALRIQFYSLMSDLNLYLIKINNIVYKLNSAFSKISSIEDKSNFNFIEQMTNLLNEINNSKKEELPIVKNSIQGINLDAIKNINFKTTLGNKTTIEIDKNNTIDELLKQYMKKIDKSIIDNSDESLFFTYNAEKLEFGDDRKIEDVFSTNNNPTILVSEF